MSQYEPYVGQLIEGMKRTEGPRVASLDAGIRFRASRLAAAVALLFAVGCGDTAEVDVQAFCMHEFGGTGRCFAPAIGGSEACAGMSMPVTFDCPAEGYTKQCVGEDSWVMANYPCDFSGSGDEPSSSQCADAGGSCVVNGDCCANQLCVEDGTTSTCLYECTSDSECASGCCAALDGGGGVCADSRYCQPTNSPDRCGECLSSCRGLSSCCTGTGCICDDAC